VSALINPAWWLICAAVLVCLVAPDPRRTLRAGLRWATATPVLVLIAFAGVANLGARAMLGHVVPGDFAQEVVGARSMREGAALYPDDVNATVREWLVAEPPAVPAWLPGPPARWLTAAQHRGRNRLVAQAHPPTLLLAAAPGILVFGGYGAFWILTVLTVAVAALTATVLVTALAPAASRRERILAVLALVSWQPVLATVRDGQVSVLIGGLLVLAWADLRRGRDSRAGALVGSAAALKLFPLLLLVLLAVRRGRACAVAALVVAGTIVLAAVVLGPDTWIQYAASARAIAWSFADAPYNLSLLPRLRSVVPAPFAALAYPMAAAAALGATLLMVKSGGAAVPLIRTLDVEFASMTTLAMLLSPVAWHHYVFTLALPLVVLVANAWVSGRRAPLVGALSLVAVLSIPDDVWRAAWWGMPAGVPALVSPGSAVLVLWAGLLRVGTGSLSPRGSTGVRPPARCALAE
jgi:alpha-1,2-mannosyltransferase